MNINLTETQKQLLVAALVATVVALASLGGYQLHVTPVAVTAPATVSPDAGGFTVGAKAVNRNGIICDSGETNCVESQRGMNIVVYSDSGTTQKFKVDGATGNVTSAGDLSVTGLITVGGSYVGITPVATATPISGGYKFNGAGGIGTATPVLIVNSAGTSNLISARANDTPVFTVGSGGAIGGASLTLAGTPVAWATPQTLFFGAATANQYVQCGNTNVTASATFTPIAGATPVGNPLASMGTVTGDAARVAGAYSAGTFTLSVYNTALTPAANTTPVAVEWCYVYNK
ncbi:MAG: hypothetical protein WCF84_26760 [Anaerolineae bacterium]